MGNLILDRYNRHRGIQRIYQDAFTTGKYAIVVAGATRTETATAATALAGMI